MLEAVILHTPFRDWRLFLVQKFMLLDSINYNDYNILNPFFVA